MHDSMNMRSRLKGLMPQRKKVESKKKKDAQYMGAKICG